MVKHKIFLASSSELKEDRKDFEILIGRKNKEWVDQGVYLDLIVWEDFLDALSHTRLQDEYDKEIRGCDIFVMMFHTKVGRFTEDVAAADLLVVFVLQARVRQRVEKVFPHDQRGTGIRPARCWRCAQNAPSHQATGDYVMADPAFALHLGDGVYLDSDGNIIGGPEVGTVVYQAEFKLPVDPKKVADALKEVKDAFADAGDPKKNPKVLEKITEIYGFLFDANKLDATKLLGMLATISKIAGTVAPVLLVVGFAFDVAKMFGLFKDGPSALEQLMVKRFDELKTQIASIGELIRNEGLQSGRQEVILLNASVVEYIDNLTSSGLTLAQLEADLVKITAAHEAHVAGLFKLISKSTYETIFDAATHTQVWGLMQWHLFTYPTGPAAPQRAVLPRRTRCRDSASPARRRESGCRRAT